MSAAARSTPLPTWRRRLLHALGVAAGWVLFGWLWWLVFSRPWASRDLTLLVAAALLLFPLVTLAWVAHNRAIFRRLGPRRGVRQVSTVYARDFNGRTVHADWAALAQAQQIEIRVEGADKRYVVMPCDRNPAPDHSVLAALHLGADLLCRLPDRHQHHVDDDSPTVPAALGGR